MSIWPGAILERVTADAAARCPRLPDDRQLFHPKPHRRRLGHVFPDGRGIGSRGSEPSSRRIRVEGRGHLSHLRGPRRSRQLPLRHDPRRTRRLHRNLGDVAQPRHRPGLEEHLRRQGWWRFSRARLDPAVSGRRMPTVTGVAALGTPASSDLRNTGGKPARKCRKGKRLVKRHHKARCLPKHRKHRAGRKAKSNRGGANR
jgi:hypothetical protein